MKRSANMFASSFVAAAAALSGCAAPATNTTTMGLPTQQLHNVARPAPAKSWLPKVMQPRANKTADRPATETESLPLAADKTAPANKSKPVDPLTLARLHERRGQTEQAVKLYEAQAEKDPNNAHIHHRLAVIAAREGQWDKARQQFEIARQLDPQNTDLLADLGYALYLQHQLPEAEACLQSAVQINPRNKAAQNNLGIVLGVQGKFNESLTAFRSGGTEAQAYANLGYVHMQLGDLDTAMEQLNHALSLDSSLRPAALALIQLNDLKRKLTPQKAEAEAVIAKAEPNEPAAESLVAEPPLGRTTIAAEDAAPAIEIAAQPTRGNDVRQFASPAPIHEESFVASAPAADGSLTELRFRHVSRVPQDDPIIAEEVAATGARSFAVTNRAHTAVPVKNGRYDSASDTADAEHVVKASAELASTPGTAMVVMSEPAKVYKPSDRLLQLRESERLEREAAQRSLRASAFPTSAPAKRNAAQNSAHSENESLNSAVSEAQAAGAASAVVKPATGEAPAMVPQIRMPRPEEMLPEQARLNQLPTSQLHPAASNTWSPPAGTIRSANDAGKLNKAVAGRASRNDG